MGQNESTDPVRYEAFLTLREAAEALGLPLWKLRRATKSGLLPSYRFVNSRPLVRLSDIQALIEQSRKVSGAKNFSS
jgi:excisionase family DNA binding protein